MRGGMYKDKEMNIAKFRQAGMTSLTFTSFIYRLPISREAREAVLTAYFREIGYEIQGKE